jgi:WD40 repeat protein
VEFISADVMITGSPHGAVGMWHLNILVRQVPAHAGPVRCMRFHPASDALLTGGGDGTTLLWTGGSAHTLDTSAATQLHQTPVSPADAAFHRCLNPSPNLNLFHAGKPGSGLGCTRMNEEPPSRAEVRLGPQPQP